ncbi:MAG TPA: heme ABC exporter ATP-binding protein CcmA [Aliidongia sp.]|nr:heme ABC exporter ATP-binding protein CcmA [Aliidongia sp.]
MNADQPGYFAGEGLTGVRGEKRLFSALGFALAPGEALILSGPNGSGKSTLLRLMAGFGRPAEGRFTWNGTDIATDAEAHRARLHYVGHLDGLKPALTVAETVAFWSALAGETADPAAALAPLGLQPLAAMPCRFLSSGQRRRLTLSRLALRPAPLWLLDEPTVGLDRDSLDALSRLIAGHRARGGLVILSTHQGIDVPDPQTLSLPDFPPARTGGRVLAGAALDW